MSEEIPQVLQKRNFEKMSQKRNSKVIMKTNDPKSVTKKELSKHPEKGNIAQEGISNISRKRKVQQNIKEKNFPNFSARNQYRNHLEKVKY